MKIRKTLKKFAALALSALLLVSLVSCGEKAGKGENSVQTLRYTATAATVNEETFAEEEFQEYVNLFGRTVYRTNYQAVQFDNVAAGFEVKFKGTAFYAEMRTIKQPKINPNREMYSVICVFIDGEKDPLQTIINVETEAFERYTLCEGLPYGEHTIKVLKTDDPLVSSWLVRGYETDGELLPAPERKTLKIEAYGDSITSGGDSLIGDGPSYDVVPGTGHGAATYATYAAQDLGAEVNVFSRSGICLYAANSADTINVVEKIYKNVSPLNANPWDLQRYVPDIVIIGLGTNDELGNQFSVSGFAAALRRMITGLSEAYGKDTTYVCVYGYMNKNNDVENAIASVKTTMNAEGYSVHSLKFQKAVNGHPSVAEHRAGGYQLSALLRELGF